MDSEEYDKAQEEIAKALAVNPKSAEAFSLLASINFVRNNTDDFNKYVQTGSGDQPALQQTVRHPCRKLRAAAALQRSPSRFAREALKINPSDWNAMSMLGVNLMRIGEEEEGKAGTRQSIQRRSVQCPDRATHSKLLDSFENSIEFDTPHFKVKLHEKEVAVLRPYVTELLERPTTR